MLTKVTGKAAKAGTHAHYAGEFGSQKMTKSLEKDPAYRAARAQHFAKEAHRAAAAHATATGHAQKAAHALLAAHSAKMAAKHARAAAKLAPGSEHDLNGREALKAANKAHESVSGKAVGGGATRLSALSGNSGMSGKSVAPSSGDKPKTKKEQMKDPAWRAERAQHFANVAKEAAAKHATATGAAKNQHELEIAHAVKRATAHANAVSKMTKGDNSPDAVGLRNKAHAAKNATNDAHKSIHSKSAATSNADKVSSVDKTLSADKAAHPEDSAFLKKKAQTQSQIANEWSMKADDALGEEKKILLATAAASHQKSSVAYKAAGLHHAAAYHEDLARDALKKINDIQGVTKGSVSGHVSTASKYSKHEFYADRDEFGTTLSSGERLSALYYSGNGYKAMNKVLRTDAAHDHVTNDIKNLDAVIDKSSLKSDTLLFRGAGDDAAYSHYVGLIANSATHYTEKGYSSTSIDKPFKKSVVMHITVAAGRKGAPIPSNSSEENEILLPRNQRFRIDHYEHDVANKKLVMHVTAVDHE